MMRHHPLRTARRHPTESYEAQPGRTESTLVRLSILLIVIGLFFLLGLRIAN
jgi:hypothetical protein